MCSNVGSIDVLQKPEQWNIYVQCGNHIYSVINVKYVYSAHCHVVDCIDFIYGTYMCIHLPYKFIRYLAYVTYMPNLVGIYVSSRYLGMAGDVCTVVGCVLAHIGSIYLFNMFVV